MKMGQYPGYLEIHKAVMKGGDGKFKPANDYQVILPVDAEIILDIKEGYALEPIVRSTAINNTQNVKPVLGFKIRKL